MATNVIEGTGGSVYDRGGLLRLVRHSFGIVYLPPPPRDDHFEDLWIKLTLDYFHIFLAVIYHPTPTG